MLAATPPGQRCALGALMAAVVAADRGWRVHYLGAELDAQEAAAAARKLDVTALCLSIVLALDCEALQSYFEDLRTALGKNTAIHAGGPGSAACRAPLESLGVHLHSNLFSFAEAVATFSS
jgi:methylmalonyl-CoA mutase cobalamin-binding subunit